MLNELYSIYKGLDAVGESPKTKHNDIQSPGMGTTFRVMLGKEGQVTSVRLMKKEQLKDTWSLGNGFKNHFPAVKVVHPLLVSAHPDYINWKTENRNPSEEDYRKIIKRLADHYSPDLSYIQCWPNYRKQILLRKEQLATYDECRDVYQLFDRYSKTETGVEILNQVAEILIAAAMDGADGFTLKAICLLLFGDDVNVKGEVKDGKRITFMLDYLPDDDNDTYASSRTHVDGLSDALFASELKSGKNTRNDECALTGKSSQVVYDIFPKEKLSVIGNTSLYARNATTSGPTVNRYKKSGAEAYSISDQLSQELAASISFLNSERFKDKTWARLPSSTGSSPSLLLAYCKDDLDLTITPLVTGESEIDDIDDYLNATDTVLASFEGKKLSLDAIVDFVEIIVLDKANRKVNFSTTANIAQLKHSVKHWKHACQNTPDLKLFALVGKKVKRMSSPWAISPQQVMYLSRYKYIRDGNDSTTLPGVSFADVMKLFLGNSSHTLANRLLKRITEQFQPLINNCASSRLQWVLKDKAHIKTNPKNNTQALNAVTLLALLLFKFGRTKEIYMKDFAFQLGQLCSAMDELHIGYCKNERNGDIPTTLLGNQVYGMALQNPISALAVLASRRRPYDSWVRRQVARNIRSEDNAITAAIFAQRWMSKQAKSLNEFLSSHIVERSDTYKAELMLGYLAGRPFNETKKSAEPENNQGEKQ